MNIVVHTHTLIGVDNFFVPPNSLKVNNEKNTIVINCNLFSKIVVDESNKNFSWIKGTKIVMDKGNEIVMDERNKNGHG